MSYTWLLNRLKTFTLTEFFFRISQNIARQREKHLLKLEQHRIKKIRFISALNVPNINQLHLPEYLHCFGIQVQLREKMDWHSDPYSAGSFDKKFCFSMSPRTHGAKCVKHTWEINRFHFLPGWAINYKATGDEKYLKLINSAVTNWIEENPYLLGVNWYSGLEVSIRLLNWWLTLEILYSTGLKEDNTFYVFIEKIWNPSVYQHIRFISNHLSGYSSANNHLIGELAGLFVACCAWEFKGSTKWRRKSQNLLEREILRQHNQGVNKEETFEYIQFITDFLVLSYWLGRQTQHVFSESFESELKKIFEYIFEATDINGDPYYYGDEDDGYLFKPKLKQYNNFRSILASGVFLFGNKKFKSKTSSFGIKNLLLFGKKGELAYNEAKTTSWIEKSSFFQKQGHFYFKNSEKGIYAHFDVAPLGYLTTAAHGHADALSFVLKVQNQWFLVDPGTYVYHKEPDLRRYFKGTLSHNTIRIDNKDQARSVAPMIWLDHYTSKVMKYSIENGLEQVIGTHDGYEKTGVGHHRSIQYDKNGHEFIILDQLYNLNGKGHKAEILFHLHPQINILTITGNKFELHNADQTNVVQLELPEIFNYSIVKGQREPLLGWYSRGFYQVEPTSVIVGFCDFASDINCITQIHIK